MEPCWKDIIDLRSCVNAGSISTHYLGSCFRSNLKASLGVMPTNVFWVAGPWRGRLGIVPRPRGGDWLGDETAAWREAGIEMVVSLLEPEEEAQLVLEGEATAAATSGIDFRSFPIPDRGIPASREAFAELASDIVNALDLGKNVAVHCRQGIGRSGMIVGGALMAAGKDLPTALKVIKESRGVEVPETEEQQRWLQEFASWLLTAQAAQHFSRRTTSQRAAETIVSTGRGYAIC
jgi:protein-tyrosine phosphatase